MQKVLIIGADGFIGMSLFRYLSEQADRNFCITGTRFIASEPVWDFLDITAREDLEDYLLKTRPDFVVLLAGTKDVKRCEKDFNYAKRLNTQPVIDIIEIIENHQLHINVLYFSSDYVFDGDTGSYRATDPTHPKTHYGKSKVLSENALKTSSVDFKIIRTSAVMGKGAVFFDWLVNSLQRDERICLFNNVYFSPTPQSFLNEILYYVITNYQEISDSILHIVGDQRLTRFELAEFMKNKITDSKAELCPEQADLNHSTFQKDLSLIQSEFIQQIQQRTFYSYLKQELS